MRYTSAAARTICRRFLAKHGMTQTEFAERIGMKPHNFSRWLNFEANRKSVTDRVLSECATIETKETK